MNEIDCARSEQTVVVEAQADGVTLSVRQRGDDQATVDLNTAEADLLGQTCLEAVVEVAEA